MADGHEGTGWLGERGETGAKVQRCKLACGRCKGKHGVRITEYRVRITDPKDQGLGIN